MSELESQTSAGITRAFTRIRWTSRRARTPVIQQLTQLECGVASLAMVLARHGRHVPLEALRDEIGVDRDGANAYNILAAARRHGLRARGLRLDVSDLAHLPEASILHWEFNHFLVFERISGQHVHLIDPATGRRRLSLDRVSKAFTGVALVFEPSEQFEQVPQRVKGLRRHLSKVFAGGQLTRVLMLSLILQCFALAAPIVTGAIVDSVVPRADVRLLAVLAVGLATTVLFHFVSSLTRSILLLQLRTALDASMSTSFLDHLVALPLTFFQRRSAGDLLMRLNSNSTIREILTSGMLSAILDGGIAVLYLLGLLSLSPSLGGLALAFGLAQAAVFCGTRTRQRELMAEDLRTQAKARGYEIEILNGIETLKSLGSETKAVEHWANLFVDTLNTSLARGRLSAAVESALSTLRLAAPIAVLMLGAVRVLAGELSLGSMLALNALAVGFLVPLATLVGTASQLQILATYLDRLDDVLEAKPEADFSQLTDVKALSGAIRLEDVSFRYGERAPLVLREISLDVKPGMFVAIVGPSGSGKSTLASLLVALYRPSEGRVLYDGRDLASLNPRSVRQHVGVVMQKPYLFAGSVRANIALSDPALPLAQIVEAAQVAKIHDEIMAMPMQYETLVRDGGSALSGGQRQRLALARALVHQPSVVLLDEATSALDALTEARVQEALDQMACTRIVIAHRLSTTVRADLILVMAEGKIIERGTHDELMARGGTYRELVAAQLTPADVA